MFRFNSNQILNLIFTFTYEKAGGWIQQMTIFSSRTALYRLRLIKVKHILQQIVTLARSDSH